MNSRATATRPFLVGALCACGVALVGCQTTSDIGIERGGVEVVRPNGRVAVVFSRDDERHIRDYYRNHGPAAVAPEWGPPGRGRGRGRGRKHGDLPPGIQKRLQRGKPIPPGLQRGRLPQELEGRLRRLPESYVHLRVGGNIVIENLRTGVVVDIIRDLGN